VIGKLSKRGVDLRNVKQEEAALSSVGHAPAGTKINRLEGDKAKEIIKQSRAKLQGAEPVARSDKFASPEKRRTSQTVIQFVRDPISAVATNFKKLSRLKQRRCAFLSFRVERGSSLRSLRQQRN